MLWPIHHVVTGMYPNMINDIGQRAITVANTGIPRQNRKASTTLTTLKNLTSLTSATSPATTKTTNGIFLKFDSKTGGVLTNEAEVAVHNVEMKRSSTTVEEKITPAMSGNHFLFSATMANFGTNAVLVTKTQTKSTCV